jgi:hypothetical protein
MSAILKALSVYVETAKEISYIVNSVGETAIVMNQNRIIQESNGLIQHFGALVIVLYVTSIVKYARK